MPCFYDPAGRDYVQHVEKHWRVIREELLAAVSAEDTGMEAYRDLEKTDRTAAWKTVGLMYWTLKSRVNIARFPKTWEVFRSIPNLSSCSLHLLEPKASIKPHIGDTDAMYRCHMGLVVPGTLPQCGFRVGDETRSWEEGKVFIFNDARLHTAWNNTDHDRFVISFDVMRPEFADRRFWIASQVLGKIWVEVLYQHVGFLRRFFSARPIKGVFFVIAKAYFRIRVAIG